MKTILDYVLTARVDRGRVRASERRLECKKSSRRGSGRNCFAADEAGASPFAGLPDGVGRHSMGAIEYRTKELSSVCEYS